MGHALPKNISEQDENTYQDAHQTPDFVKLAGVLMDVSERAQPLLKNFIENHEFEISESVLDPMNMRQAYTHFMKQLMADPQRLVQMQMSYWQDFMTLWQESASRFIDSSQQEHIHNGIYKPEKGDRRFKSQAWEESAFFDFIKQSYLMTGQWVDDLINATDGLDSQTRQKVSFYTKQYLNALSPSNFIMTNPDVLQETIDSGGDNLIRGLQNLMEDLERGEGELAISTTDYDAFEVGKNLATTPGKVIYQNELMQLIQYEPVTEEVYKRPLLIVPPWINKYYILDLRPENSFIKWMTEQGFTVFTISWVNPDKKLAQKRFEDYMAQGVLEALEQIEKATGEKEVNALGYCLGGTLLATTLSWLAAKGQDSKIASATFLTTMVDFEQAGDMKLFIDEEQLQTMETEMKEKGYLPADTLKRTFSLLRANDLIWSFVVNNYLLGREPFPFDLLYWNDDASNMPAEMHSFYLRKLYGQNLLRQAGGITMKGTPIHLKKIKTPCYFLSTKEDHIAPWVATYATTQLTSGPVRFTLAASGHVAGVVNPPAKNKYCFWTNDINPPDADQWLDSAAEKPGSWWPDWHEWARSYGNDMVPARIPGGGKLKPIEDAPGSYVKMAARQAGKKAS